MIHIPFNNDPTSVSVRTSSYTIPSGSYAYVTAFVENGGTFTIDASTMLSSEAQTSGDIVDVSVSGYLTANQSYTYTVPSGYFFEGQFSYDRTSGTSSVNFTVGGAIPIGATGTGGDIENIKAGSGAAITVSTPSSTQASYNIIGYSKREHKPETNAAASFWLPSGTVINGTGTWRATVSLYNELT